jgi:hypothetical protein
MWSRCLYSFANPFVDQELYVLSQFAKRILRKDQLSTPELYGAGPFNVREHARVGGCFLNHLEANFLS